MSYFEDKKNLQEAVSKELMEYFSRQGVEFFEQADIDAYDALLSSYVEDQMEQAEDGEDLAAYLRRIAKELGHESAQEKSGDSVEKLFDNLWSAVETGSFPENWEEE